MNKTELRTCRVIGGALRLAGGNRATAAARLRVQAAEYLRGAAVALVRGAGDERARQDIAAATRRIVAAGRIDRGDLPPSLAGLIEANGSVRPLEPPGGGVSAGRGRPLPAASLPVQTTARGERA